MNKRHMSKARVFLEKFNEDAYKKGDRLKAKNDFNLNVLDGSDAGSVEVKKGNVLEITGKWNTYWYTVELLTKADFVHEPGLSGKDFKPFKDTLKGVTLGLSVSSKDVEPIT